MTEKSEKSKQSATSVMAHEKPLQILLMDDAEDFTHVQRELLAVANVLRAAKFGVHILCREHSRLKEFALEDDFATVVLPQDNAGFFRNLWATWKLLWKYDKKSPCCIHAFSGSCLPLLQAFVTRRLNGATVSLYSHFNPPIHVEMQTAPVESTRDTSIKDMSKMPSIPKMPKISPVKPTLTSTDVPNEEAENKNLACIDSGVLMQQVSSIDKIIVPTTHWRHQFAENAMDVSRLHVIHSACPRNELAQRQLQKDRFVFLIPAVLMGSPELDCMDGIMKSMLELHKDDSDLPHWEVRVVSNEQYVANYVQKANALGISERLTILTGINSDFALQEVLPHANAIILPETSVEGNVSAVMAAWCLGVPIIATEVAAHLELVDVADKVRYFSRGQAKNNQMQFIDFEDVHSLTLAMKELLSNPKRYAALANASEAMATYGDMPRLTQSYLDIYKNFIASKGWVLPS